MVDTDGDLLNLINLHGTGHSDRSGGRRSTYRRRFSGRYTGEISFL